MTDEDDDFRIVFELTEDDIEVRKSALGDLLTKYGGLIKGTVRNHFGGQLADGEDHVVLMRVAERVWRYAYSYDDSKAKLSTWLVGIAFRETNKLFTENKPKHLLVEEEVLDARFYREGLEEGEPTKEEKKEVRDLKLIVSRLPKLQRAIIEADLACNGTADGERLAKLHGTSKNSIYVSRNKAHAKIEQEMRKLGHFNPQHIHG